MKKILMICALVFTPAQIFAESTTDAAPPSLGTKPIQSRDLNKFPLASMFYQDLMRRAEKSRDE